MRKKGQRKVPNCLKEITASKPQSDEVSFGSVVGLGRTVLLEINLDLVCLVGFNPSLCHFHIWHGKGDLSARSNHRRIQWRRHVDIHVQADEAIAGFPILEEKGLGCILPIRPYLQCTIHHCQLSLQPRDQAAKSIVVGLAVDTAVGSAPTQSRGKNVLAGFRGASADDA